MNAASVLTKIPGVRADRRGAGDHEDPGARDVSSRPTVRGLDWPDAKGPFDCRNQSKTGVITRAGDEQLRSVLVVQRPPP